MSDPTEEPAVTEDLGKTYAEHMRQPIALTDTDEQMIAGMLEDDLDLYDPDLEVGALLGADWEPPALRPEDEARANGMMRALRGLRRRKAKTQAVADADIARTRAWLAMRNAKLDPAITRLERALDGFMRGWHSMNPKRKKLELPAGELKLTAPRDSLAPIDPDVFLKWAAEHARDDLVRQAPSPAVDKIKAVTEKGARLPDIVDEQGRTIERWEARYTVGEGDEREFITVEGVEYRKPAADTFKVTPSA